jgi:hypothetical protein
VSPSRTTRLAAFAAMLLATTGLAISQGGDVANPNAKNLIGTDGRIVKDSTGKLFGVEQLAGAQEPEGEITVHRLPVSETGR